MNSTAQSPGISSGAHPASYPRRILLAVCGLSPQIVTETLYALASAPEFPFVPTEVHLITTREGAQRAELSLLSDDLGWFHKLCADPRTAPPRPASPRLASHSRARQRNCQAAGGAGRRFSALPPRISIVPSTISRSTRSA